MASEATIAIVDDNAEDLINLVSYLQADYSLINLDPQVELMGQLLASAPDIVLIDDMLQEPNCYQICQELRANCQCSGVLLILMSDLSAEELDSEIEYLGADDYICKPVDPGELLEKLATLLAFHRA